MIYHVDSEKGKPYLLQIEHDLLQMQQHVTDLMQQATGEERKRYKSLFSGRPNYAVAYLHLSTETRKYIAFSGVQTREDLPSWMDAHGFTLAYLVEPETMLYPAEAVSPDNVIVDYDQPYLRNVDSESKIIEQIAHDLESLTLRGNSQKGTLILYTLKEPCASCELVIREFMYNNRKDLEIKVLFSDYLKKGVKAHGKPIL